MINKKLFLFVIFLITLSACAAEGMAGPVIPATASAVPPTNTPPPTITPQPEIALEAGDPARGQVIFENGGAHEAFEPSYYCVHCHSLDGSDGDGPTLQGIAMAAGERVPGLTAEEYIRQSIMEPDAYVVEGYDHSMGRIFSKLLSEQEVHDLVAFLLTLSGDAVTAQPNP
jgi:mono/diheme cytochrome c family protein